jgi:cyclophilin family peptidyl-prolyl cis-trans isomerase
MLLMSCWTGWAQSNGIFADFTTSLGSFTCQLDYTNAPKTVANFIALATGARPWMDPASGQVRTNPFFNGLLFHRVVAGFMIQGGSPNGLGSDGPGYVIPDEFSPVLKHTVPCVISMANSGPNSGGAQFFITVANTSWLDNVHSVFGRVTTGTSVVHSISRVVTDSSSKPLTNVVMQSVVIRRVGTAAQAFNINTCSLPVVASSPLRLTVKTNTVTLQFTNSLNAELFLRESTNLSAWTPSSLGVDITAPATNRAQLSQGAAPRFYALTRVQYPSSTLVPRAVTNRNLTLFFNNGVGTITNRFNNAGGGIYNYGTDSGTIAGYAWNQEIYRGRLWPIYYSGLVTMTLRLDFTNNAGGTFSGTAYSSPSFSVSGTFALAP